MNLNPLRKIRFDLIRRIFLRPNHLANSSIHQHACQLNISGDKQQFLFKVHMRNELISVQKRFASKKDSKNAKDSDSDSDSDETDDSDSSSDESDGEDEGRIAKPETINRRVDMMLKYTLGGTKARIETFLNEDRIRVNGERIVKKSDEVMQGDVVDVIDGFASYGSDKLKIIRCEFLEIADKANSRGKYLSKVNVTKNLIVDNYEKAPWAKISSN